MMMTTMLFSSYDDDGDADDDEDDNDDDDDDNVKEEKVGVVLYAPGPTQVTTGTQVCSWYYTLHGRALDEVIMLMSRCAYCTINCAVLYSTHSSYYRHSSVLLLAIHCTALHWFVLYEVIILMSPCAYCTMNCALCSPTQNTTATQVCSCYILHWFVILLLLMLHCCCYSNTSISIS